MLRTWARFSQRSLCLLFRGVSSGVKSRQQTALIHISLINGVDPEMTNRKAVNSKRKGPAKRPQIRRTVRGRAAKISSNRAMAPARGSLQLVPSQRFAMPRSGSIPTGLLGPCAVKYLAAIALPWSAEAQASCIPDGNSRESHKLTGFSRFSPATSATSGVGWVVCMPCLANNLPCVFYTTAQYTGRAINPLAYNSLTGVLTVTPGWQAVYCANIPYDAASMLPSILPGTSSTPTISGRIVSVGLSLEPTMRVMDMGGLVVCYTAADHVNMYGKSLEDIQGYAATDIKRVDNDKCFLVDFGHSAAEVSYSNPSPYVANLSTGTSDPIENPTYTSVFYPYSMGMPAISTVASQNIPGTPTNLLAAALGLGAITQVIGFTAGSPTTSVSFQAEYILHAEYVGSAAQASVTPTHRDPVGFGHVQEAASRAPQIKQSKRVSWSESVFSGLREVAREYGPTMLKEGAKMLAGLIL